MKRIVFVTFLTLVNQALGQGLGASLHFQDGTVHFELSGSSSWNYDVQKKQEGKKWWAEILLDPINEKHLLQLKSFKNSLIPQVQIVENSVDKKMKVRFELANKDVEVFDYLTDQPSRLILDFYENVVSSKSSQAATQVEKADEEKGSETVPTQKGKSTKLSKKIQSTEGKTSEEKLSNGKGRSPATADYLALNEQGSMAGQIQKDTSVNLKSGIFDGADPFFDRFDIKPFEIREEAIIKSKENYYIPFPNVDSSPEEFRRVLSALNIYNITAQENDENKQARLLWTLFEKKRDHVFLKTLNWFQEKYPNSQYNEIIDFMTAEVHLRRWKETGDSNAFDLAQQKFIRSVQLYPNSTMAEKASFMVGALNYEKGDYINALRLFQLHKENEKLAGSGKFSHELAKLGMALSFWKINKFQEAQQHLEDLEKNSKFKGIQQEAAFRLGDVLSSAQSFPKAVEAYQRAQKNYPEVAKNFPNSYYNQAQALFRQGLFKESLDTYREFIRLFPNHENMAYAMTRIGELLEILGADSTKVMGAFLETYFRNGENPRAIIARLRMLSARMKGMKAKEVEETTQQILQLSKKIELPGIEQFATVMIAEGFRNRGENQKAVDLLARYYQENPTSVDSQFFQKRIVANIADKIKKEVDGKRFIEGLKTYKKHADNWLKSSPRLDIQFDLGRAFEQGGVPAEAANYYRQVLNKIYSVQGTVEGKELAVKEKLPSDQVLNLRLAQVEAQQGRWSQSYDYLKNIKKPEVLTEDEQIERIILASQVFEQRGDLDSAIRYVTDILREWKGIPGKVADPYYRLGVMELKHKKPEEAYRSFDRVRQLSKESPDVSEEILFNALKQMAEISLNSGKSERAVELYQEILDQFESKRPLGSLRYQMGKIHFDRGDLQKANTAWGQFKGERSEFWSQLAQEQLKNADWKDGYKKYIQRIPAMSRKE